MNNENNDKDRDHINFQVKVNSDFDDFDIDAYRSSMNILSDNHLDRDLILNLRSTSAPVNNAIENINSIHPERKNIKVQSTVVSFPQEQGLNFSNINHTYGYDIYGLNMENIIIPNHEEGSKLQFKKQIKDLRENMLEYFEILKTNLVNYLDSQKNHLSNSLTTIETLFELESQSQQGEEEKNKMIERKIEDFSREFGGLLNDFQKISNNK